MVNTISEGNPGSKPKHPQIILPGVQRRISDVLDIRCDRNFFPKLDTIKQFQRVLVIEACSTQCGGLTSSMVVPYVNFIWIFQSVVTGMKNRNIGFWVIQGPGWLLLLYLVYAQAISAFSYDLGVTMETQESAEMITEVGVRLVGTLQVNYLIGWCFP